MIQLVQTPNTIGNQFTTMLQPSISKDKKIVQQQVIILMTTTTPVNIENIELEPIY